MMEIKRSKPVNKTINFFIIDKDSTFNNKIERELNRDPYYQIHTYTEIQSFLDQYKKKTRTKDEIDIIIIDMNFFTQDNFKERIGRIKRLNKTAEIIVLTDDTETEDIPVTLEQGIYSIIKKNENATFRIENAAKGIKNLKSFLTKKREVRTALIIFLIFSLVVFIVLMIFRSRIFEGAAF